MLTPQLYSILRRKSGVGVVVGGVMTVSENSKMGRLGSATKGTKESPKAVNAFGLGSGH
jgi:hypothetical protein